MPNARRKTQKAGYSVGRFAFRPGARSLLRPKGDRPLPEVA